MIQTHGNSFIQSPILIGNIKAQFSLATLKLNSYWQYQNPIFIGNIKTHFLLATSKPNFHWHYFIKKKRAQDYQHLARKKYRGKMLLWQKRTVAIILWRNSSRSILRIMFSYYKPVKYMDIICIATSIIYTFNIRGKHSNPQDHHLSYDAIIKNHEHYLQHGIHQSKYCLQKYFETCPFVSNITTNCPKAHCKHLWKTQKYLLIKFHEEWKPMAICAYNLAHVSKSKQKNTSKRQMRTTLVHF